jgi:KGK domain
VSNQFQPLADGEVVSVNNTYRVSDLAAEIRSKVAASLAEWSDDQGIDGEALRFGSKGWEKGKVRLHLSIEFCPNDAAAQASAPSMGSASPYAPAAPGFSGGGDGGNKMVAAATAAGMVATATVATALPDAPIEPAAEIDFEENPFDLGLMSEATGEIDINLNDGDSSGYVDFDLSDSLPEVSLDELVAQSEGARPSIIDEVWNEMSQPNWPGVSRV